MQASRDSGRIVDLEQKLLGIMDIELQSEGISFVFASHFIF